MEKCDNLILTGWGYAEYVASAAVALKALNGNADVMGVSRRRLPELMEEIAGRKKSDRWSAIYILGVSLIGDPERLAAALGKPLILVVENGKPLDLSRESEVCGAILMAFFGGESGAKAIVEALTGRYSPAGRLPLSLPRSSTRIPCYYSMLPGGAEDFLEGPKNALYPFGYGLSYTKFEYSDLQIDQIADEHAIVHCDVQNVGPMDGDEVVQLYLDDCESSVVTPPMLLKGFERIHLKAGEKKHVIFKLTPGSFRLMDIHYNWTVEPGRFRVLVGAGSRDIRLEGEITL